MAKVKSNKNVFPEVVYVYREDDEDWLLVDDNMANVVGAGRKQLVAVYRLEKVGTIVSDVRFEAVE